MFAYITYCDRINLVVARDDEKTRKNMKKRFKKSVDRNSSK